MLIKYIYQLNSNLTVSQDAISINTSGATGGGIVYKYGRICVLSAEIKPITAGVGLSLGQVLNKYYPINQTHLSVDYYSTGTQSEGVITNGGTLMFNVIEANTSLKVSGVWISAT